MKKNFLFLLMMLAPVFAWAQTDFSTGTVTIPDFTYQGTGTEDAIVVKFDGAALTKTTDYTITAFEVFDVEADAWAAVATPRHAGKFRATVVGDGVNYTGTETVEFTVKQAGITVNLLGATKTYGEPLDSKYVTYSLYGDLKAGDDEDNVAIIFEIPLKDENVGVHPYSEIDLEGITAETDDYLVGVNVATSAKVTVNAKDISAAPAWTIDAIDPVTFSGAEYTNGNGIDVVVKNGAGAEVAEDGNFTISYVNNVNAGTATVTVTGTGNYTGTINWDFIINPLTVTAADITIADIDPYTYAKVAYEPTPQVTDQLGNVMRAEDFTWAWEDNTNASEEAKAKAQIVKGGSSNYTFEGTDLVVTKNFTINPLAIAKASGAFEAGFAMSNDSKVYTGLPLTTSEVLKWTHGDPEVTDDLAEGTDYEIDYKEKNTNVGNCYFDIVGKGNFTGTVTGKRRLRIDPRDISEAEVTITFDAASYPYAGGPQTPSFTVVDSKSGSDVTLVEGTDYTIKEWKNNKNVYDGITYASVVIEGKGNYGETNEETFEITKATLKIQPKADQAKFIGSLDPAEFEWEFAEGFGLQGEDEGKEAEILSELPVVTRDAGEGLGNYTLHISNIASITADPNYDVVEITGVTFAIVPTKLFIRVKEGLEKYYGATVPAADAYAEYFTVTGLLGTDAVDDVTFTLKDKDGNDLATPLAAGDAIPFGEYTIAATAATVSPNPTKYDVIFEADYNLTVGKKPVVVAIDDAAKDYGDADPAAFTYADFDADLEYGETAAGLGLTPVLTREEGEAVGTYEITGTLEADNYVFTFTPATFTINPTTFALNRVPKADFENAAENTAAKLVNDYDGVPVDVKFSMYNLVGDPAVKEEQEFKAEKWYTLVLPFETSVAEVSAAFGYAVVNKFVGKTDDDLVKFRLHMQTLPANEPFIVKIYQDMKLSDVVAFTGKTIVKPATVNENADPYVEIDDIRFIGTYKGKTDGFRANEWYFSFDEKYGDYYSGNETNKTYLRPLGAYLQAQPGVEVRGLSIEEADGTITVIKAMNAEENSNDSWYSIDGKKMQKPATKGVYIQNGKKVVVK